MKFRFHTFSELEGILQAEHITAEDYAVKREAFISGTSEARILTELDRRIAVTRRSLIKGLETPQHSRSGLTKGGAVSFAASDRGLMQDPFCRRIIAYSLSINEVNACGGKIVSFPTAGSSGIVPGTIWAWWDSHASGARAARKTPSNTSSLLPLPPTPSQPFPAPVRGAFLIASLAGVLIAQRATLAGSEGGCQAECGAAGAMAASALGYLEGLSLGDCFSAAALSLKNSLGLACDPVAGLVEVPCVKRNAFVAINAVLAVDLTLAGIQSVIPFDEVVSAMKEIGDTMPGSLKETAAGGLAITPTGLFFKAQIFKDHEAVQDIAQDHATPLKDVPRPETGDIKIYTDGGCAGNPGPGGWAYVIIGDKDPQDKPTIIIEKWGAEKYTTNNRMELQAVIAALETLVELKLSPGNVTVYTDSQYVQKGISIWIHAWKKKAWMTTGKQPVKNKELWVRLDALATAFPITWEWVKGHAGDTFNERCDRMAQEAIRSLSALKI
jgi:ribonuclease HI/L-serine deaminase